MKLKGFFKEMLRRIFSINAAVSYTGPFASWCEASNNASGYDTDEIFNKVSKSAYMVEKGLAKYERDGVLFHERDYDRELLAYIIAAIPSKGQVINVLDYGGGLGSTFYKNKDFFSDNCISCEWNVIEQKRFVEFGKKNLECENLKFCYSLKDVMFKKKFDFILFGSSIQYIQDNMEILTECMSLGAKYICLNKTPIGIGSIIVERVKEPIYNAQYPMEIFEEDTLLKVFETNGYVLIDKWLSRNACPVYIRNKLVANYLDLIFKKYE